MIVNRTKPTLYRIRNQDLSSHNFKLSAVDLKNLTAVRQAFEEKHGVFVSTSIALSLALEGMAEEIAAGILRINREVTEGLSRVKEAAR
ncbi:hypothetical protein [Microvirga roseola]|uniref:hypothetical protein n=1 Tax=Microvirga roseola TaxID=2883126 RepID=UPI001E64BC47|nr:hypothetical protein [Microvirga roseola]